ncbi:hypothetical protein vBAbaMD22_155 [Acinetobacter phage vB_AbaM_D22]|nr:hypothetical protein vBAbaMD22_155 [Acinetobacter phage vB_AbaM_D22]
MGNRTVEFWKEKLIPEVKDIDQTSGEYLEFLITQYEKHGLTGHPLLNTITFTPSNRLSNSFYWAATEMGRDHWELIDAELEERGVYKCHTH